MSSTMVQVSQHLPVLCSPQLPNIRSAGGETGLALPGQKALGANGMTEKEECSRMSVFFPTLLHDTLAPGCAARFNGLG